MANAFTCSACSLDSAARSAPLDRELVAYDAIHGFGNADAAGRPALAAGGDIHLVDHSRRRRVDNHFTKLMPCERSALDRCSNGVVAKLALQVSAKPDGLEGACEDSLDRIAFDVE